MQIEAQRPVAQIIEIVIDTRLHLVQGSGLAAIAVDLGPAGNTGLDLVADHIALYQIAVDFVVRHGMRARADDAHAPLQDIDELGQFVQRILAQEGADARDAGIALARLPDRLAIFAHPHGAEFIHQDLFPIKPVAALLENDGAGRIQFDGKGDEQQQRRDQRQDEQGQHDIAGPLDEPVGAREGRFAHGDDRRAANGAAAALDEVGHEHVGHEVNRGRGVLQFVEHMEDARLRSHRQRQIDELDAVFLDEVGELAQPAEQLAVFGPIEPALVPIIEKAGQFDLGIARLVNPAGKGGSLLVQADDNGSPRLLQHQQIRRAGTQGQMGANLAQGCDPEPGDQRLAGEFGDIAGGKAEKE